MHANLVGSVLGAVSESQRSRATSAGTPPPFANLIAEFSLGDAEDFLEFVVRLSNAKLRSMTKAGQGTRSNKRSYSRFHARVSVKSSSSP